MQLYRVTDANQATHIVEAESGKEAVYIALPHYPKGGWVVRHYDCACYVVGKPLPNGDYSRTQFVEVKEIFTPEKPHKMRLIKLVAETTEDMTALRYYALWQSETNGREFKEQCNKDRWTLLYGKDI